MDLLFSLNHGWLQITLLTGRGLDVLSHTLVFQDCTESFPYFFAKVTFRSAKLWQKAKSSLLYNQEYKNNHIHFKNFHNAGIMQFRNFILHHQEDIYDGN